MLKNWKELNLLTKLILINQFAAPQAVPSGARSRPPPRRHWSWATHRKPEWKYTPSSQVAMNKKVETRSHAFPPHHTPADIYSTSKILISYARTF